MDRTKYQVLYLAVLSATAMICGGEARAQSLEDTLRYINDNIAAYDVNTKCHLKYSVEYSRGELIADTCGKGFMTARFNDLVVTSDPQKTGDVHKVNIDCDDGRPNCIRLEKSSGEVRYLEGIDNVFRDPDIAHRVGDSLKQLIQEGRKLAGDKNGPFAK
jgi:hypothetical protein